MAKTTPPQASPRREQAKTPRRPRAGNTKKDNSASPGHVPSVTAQPSQRKPKYAEQEGLAHILALSQQAVEKKDAHFQKLLDKNHAVRSSITAAKKERQQRKLEARKSSDKPTRQSMMALLREKRRERSRERKRKRKSLAEEEESAEPREASPAPASTEAGPRSILKAPSKKATQKKRVSFG